jgi:hypothetical protein
MILDMTTIMITIIATTTPSMTIKKCNTHHNNRMSVTMLNALMVRSL